VLHTKFTWKKNEVKLKAGEWQTLATFRVGRHRVNHVAPFVTHVPGQVKYNWINYYIHIMFLLSLFIGVATSAFLFRAPSELMLWMEMNMNVCIGWASAIVSFRVTIRAMLIKLNVDLMPFTCHLPCFLKKTVAQRQTVWLSNSRKVPWNGALLAGAKARWSSCGSFPVWSILG
jgi:hypothetical protein